MTLEEETPSGVRAKTWILELAYDGCRLHGWQRQAQGPTVQSLVEDALAAIGHPGTTVTGAGRTDAGVHALRQVAHVRLGTRLGPTRLRAALNAHLPREVVVRSVRPAGDRFHARFGALAKRYAYGIRLASIRSPFLDRFLWRLPGDLDLPAMRDAAQGLLGRHDFSAFRGSLGKDRDPVRTLQHVHLVRRGERLWVVVQGDGFLYRMVRVIAGTLVEVGKGRRDPSEIAGILASRDRSRAGPTAPARGLYLLRAVYRESARGGLVPLTPARERG